VISDPTGAVPRSDAQRRCQQIHLLLGKITVQCSDPDTISRWVNAFRGQGGWTV